MQELKEQAGKYKTYAGFINSNDTQTIINNMVNPELQLKGWGVSRPALLKELGFESFQELFEAVGSND